MKTYILLPDLVHNFIKLAPHIDSDGQKIALQSLYSAYGEAAVIAEIDSQLKA